MEFTQFDERIAEGMLGAATAAGGISAYLDFRHAELGPGRLIAEMDARTDLLTPFGNLHGGCLSAFVDHCLGVVIWIGAFLFHYRKQKEKSYMFGLMHLLVISQQQKHFS